MAESAHKLFYYRDGGNIECALYTDIADVAPDYIAFQLEDGLVYARLTAALADVNASHIRIMKNDTEYAVLKVAYKSARQGVYVGGSTTVPYKTVAFWNGNKFLPINRLPDIANDTITLVSNWNASNNTPAIPPASEANKGYYYLVAYNTGTSASHGYANVPAESFAFSDWLGSNGVTWEKIPTPFDLLFRQVWAVIRDKQGKVVFGHGYDNVSNVCKWDGNILEEIPISTGATGWGAGIVYALAVDSVNNLYAGGDTTGVKRIIKWTGTAWENLGTGLNNACYAIAVDSSDNIYAGGTFTNAGGVAASCIAKWDGSAWSPLGSGVNNGRYIDQILLDSSGNVYACGCFTQIGGVQADCVAKWDGASWSALNSVGPGFVLGATTGHIADMCFDSSGNLYVVGNITSIGNATVNKMAKFDGTNWTAVGSGAGNGANGEITCISCDSTDKIYIGGSFSIVNAGENVSASNVAMWNGANWSALGTGTNGVVNSIFANL